MTADEARPLAASHLRIARPSRDLDWAEAFWVRGLGLEVLYRASPDAGDGHAMLIAGWPKAAWHLELVGDPQGGTAPAPPRETCSSCMPARRSMTGSSSAW